MMSFSSQPLDGVLNNTPRPITNHRLQTQLQRTVKRVRRTHWLSDSILWGLLAVLLSALLALQMRPSAPTIQATKPATLNVPNSTLSHTNRHQKNQNHANLPAPAEALHWVYQSADPHELTHALGQQLLLWLFDKPTELGQCSLERIRVGQPPKTAKKRQATHATTNGTDSATTDAGTPSTLWEARCMASRHQFAFTNQSNTAPKPNIAFTNIANLLNPSDPAAWWRQGPDQQSLSPTQGSVLGMRESSLPQNHIDHDPPRTKSEGWMDTSQGRMVFQENGKNLEAGGWQLQGATKDQP